MPAAQAPGSAVVSPAEVDSAEPDVAPTGVAPPALAEPGVHSDMFQGVEVSDPYRWLEDTDDPRVQAWVVAQKDHADRVVARLVGREALAAEVERAFAAAPTLDVVIHTPSRILLTRWLGAAPSLFAVEPGSPGERLVLSATALAERESGARIRAMVPSFDGARVALGTTRTGDSSAAVSLVDVATGRLLPDHIPDLLTTTSGTRYEVSWLPDGSGFIYPRLWPGAASGPPAERLARGRQFLHRLGTPQTADVPVLGFGVSKDVPVEVDDLPTRVLTAPGSRWAVGSVFRSSASHTEHFVAELSALRAGRPAWRRLGSAEDRPGALQLRGDLLYALTRRDADRGAVVRLDLREPSAGWTTVVAERPGVIIAFTVQEDGLYFTERTGTGVALHRQLASGEVVSLPVPSEGSVRLARGGPGASGVTVATESWASPPRWMQVRDGGVEVIPLDDGSTGAGASGLVSERLEAVSRDGTRVPVSVVHGGVQGTDGGWDGTAPLFIEAYGGFGVATDPSYSPFIRAWVELGGVYAYAHVRGGGELGDGWHTSAVRENRQRAIDDLIASVEALIARRYTSAGRVALMGISFGATLPGMAAVQRPELFGAVLYEVGQPDELRGAASDPTARRNLAEVGDLDTPEGIRLLVKNSPYHQVPASVRLPAVIVHSTSEDYNFGSVMLQAKYVARLQRANTGDRPVLWMNTGGGHQPLIGLGPDSAATALSFILWQTGHPGYQPARR